MIMISKDPVALVTGAATGIGLETALAFARAGYNVVVADRDVHRGEQAATRIRDLGRQALFVDADVSQQHDVENLHQRITSSFGRLDAACNNAGIEGETAPTADCTLENFDHIIATNLRGCFMCVREQLRIMSQQQGGGAIVNMASVAGLVGFAGLPAYCASKGGVVQLTKTAAIEYAGKGIRVNAVCPGAIKTEMIDRITQNDPDTEVQFAALHPMNRMGTAREIADAVVWLCSPGASFVTGVTLPVDGGLVAR
jgi:NAD(P)-dependent dehydrogenase (short-subunit alcohol dehydrogenase family)